MSQWHGQHSREHFHNVTLTGASQTASSPTNTEQNSPFFLWIKALWIERVVNRLYAVLEYILLWFSRPARQHKQFENRMTASSGLWFQVFMAWPSVPLDTNTFVSRNLLWFYTPFSLSLLLQLLFSQGWRNNIIIVSSFAKDKAVVLMCFKIRPAS